MSAVAVQIQNSIRTPHATAPNPITASAIRFPSGDRALVGNPKMPLESKLLIAILQIIERQVTVSPGEDSFTLKVNAACSASDRVRSQECERFGIEKPVIGCPLAVAGHLAVLMNQRAVTELRTISFPFRTKLTSFRKNLTSEDEIGTSMERSNAPVSISQSSTTATSDPSSVSLSFTVTTRSPRG